MILEIKNIFNLYSDSSCNDVIYSDNPDKKYNSIPKGIIDNVHFWDASSNDCSRSRKFGSNTNAKKNK